MSVPFWPVGFFIMALFALHIIGFRQAWKESDEDCARIAKLEAEIAELGAIIRQAVDP